MNAIAQWLKEKGKIVIPKTLDTQVFDENGKSLDRRLKTAKDEQVIQLPKVDLSMIFSDLDYSTEEQLTGKRWIDGKPIYQKSFEFETGDGTQGRTIYEDKNSFLVDINSNMNNVAEAPYFKYIETDNADGIRISFRQSNQYSNKKYNVTIQYTKTTDTASSPVAIPKVEAKHVYSTEEQVVGTWIDGKPIYERVLELPEYIAFDSNTWVQIDNSGFYDMVISAYALDNTYKTIYPIIANSDDGNLKGMQTRNVTVSFQAFIIQYTKTTDTTTV